MKRGWLLRPADRGLQVVKLKSFSKFENTTDALAAATALTDSKLSKSVPLRHVYWMCVRSAQASTFSRLTYGVML